MPSIPVRPALCATLALAGLALAAGTAGAAGGPSAHQRLVVRGDATVVDAPCAPGLCIELRDASFRGTVGSGAYSGALRVRVAEAFPNGEKGICAPLRGEIVLGAGSPNRLVVAVTGDSCQDGAGDLTTSSFTGLARFKVKYGTGAYAKATGSGIATFLEDAADHDRMTLVGRIAV